MRDRRRFERYNCLIEIKYKSLDGKAMGYCLTKDLSKEGLAVPLDKYLPPYRRLSIEIDLPDGDGKIVARALVIWCRRNKFHWQPLYSAGLRFEGVDPDSIEKLLKFASTHQWQKSEFERELEENKVPIVD